MVNTAISYTGANISNVLLFFQDSFLKRNPPKTFLRMLFTIPNPSLSLNTSNNFILFPNGSWEGLYFKTEESRSLGYLIIPAAPFVPKFKAWCKHET